MSASRGHSGDVCLARGQRGVADADGIGCQDRIDVTVSGADRAHYLSKVPGGDVLGREPMNSLFQGPFEVTW